MSEENISVLLEEKRVFKPKEEFVKQTNVKQWAHLKLKQNCQLVM